VLELSSANMLRIVLLCAAAKTCYCAPIAPDINSNGTQFNFDWPDDPDVDLDPVDSVDLNLIKRTPPSSLVSNVRGSPQELRDLVCSGRDRDCSVLLDVPEGCAGSSSTCPIAMFLHQHGARNTQFPNQRPGVFDYDMIGVYPQGAVVDGSSCWNDGFSCKNKCAWDDYACTQDPNDPEFIVGIISTLRALGAKGRIYAYGKSNGANEVQILAANAVANPAKLPLAGIAANSGQLLAYPTRSGPAPMNYNQPCAGTQPCRGGVAIAQLSIHGTADGGIPFNGGTRGPVKILESEEASNAIWAAQNGCSTNSPRETNVPATGKPVDKTTATHFVYNCPSTAPVELYKVLKEAHLGTKTLNGEKTTGVVLNFFSKVEAAHRGGAIPPPSPPPPDHDPATPPPSPPPPIYDPATPPPSPPPPSSAQCLLPNGQACVDKNLPWLRKCELSYKDGACAGCAECSNLAASANYIVESNDE